jgi:hypothetical protein
MEKPPAGSPRTESSASAAEGCGETGSEHSPEAQIRLGRRTEWVEQEIAPARGLGQRTWITDRDSYALLDTRTVTLTPVGGEGDDGAAPG